MQPRRRLGRSRVADILILILALGARIGYILSTPGYTMRHDDRAYDRLGLAIARTGVYPNLGGHPTAYRPPVFPYLLGALYSLTGSGHARVVGGRVLQALLGVLAVALLGALAGRLFGRRAAVATMLISAVYLPLVAGGTSLIVEPLTIVLELAGILAVLTWRRRGGTGWVVAAGVLGGTLTLTRSNGFLVVAALAVGVWTGRPRLSPAAWRPVVILLVSAAAVVAPWTIRNAVVLHSFIPVSDELGGTLAGTYNPVSAHDASAPALWHLLSEIPQYERQVRPLLSGPEPQLQSKLLNLALGYIGRHPLYPPKVAFYDTLRLFGLNSLSLSRFTARSAGITSAGVADAGVYSFWAVCLLALVALSHRQTRRRVPLYIWLAGGLLYISVVLVNSEAPRLRLPLDPFFLLFAGAGLAALSGWWIGRRRHAATRRGVYRRG